MASAPLAATVSNFSAAVASLATSGFIVFTSGEEGGQAWCPDCRKAVPAVVDAAAAAGVPLLVVDVGSRASWKSPAHPFRGPPLRLTCIPSLLRWDKEAGAPAEKRLSNELEDAPDKAAVATLASAFFASVS